MLKFRIKEATFEDLKNIMLNMASKEGWDYTEEDVEAFYTINKKNIHCLWNVDVEGGTLIGCAMVTRYDYDERDDPKEVDTLVSVGLFIIEEQHRRNGFGTQLLEYVYDKYIKEKPRTRGVLNSVPGTRSFYQQKGFHSVEDLSNVSFWLEEIPKEFLLSRKVRELRSDDQVAVDGYESTLFKRDAAKRRLFTMRWLSRADSKLIGYFEDKTLAGYGMMTMCKKIKGKTNSDDTHVYRLSPVYANTIEVAGALLKTFMMEASQSSNNYGKVSIVLNAFAGKNSITNSNLLQTLGFVKREGHETYPMVTDESVTFNIDPRVVAVSPLEFPNEAVFGLRDNSPPRVDSRCTSPDYDRSPSKEINSGPGSSAK